MTRKIILAVLVTLFSGTQEKLQCQNRGEEVAHIGIERIRAIPQVYVTLLVRALEQDVFIPFCGNMEGGEKILCGAGTHLQILTPQGWHAAKLRTRYGVLAVASLEQSNGTMIPAKNEAAFVYQFSRRFYDVMPRQKLRVVVDSWHDKESMQAGTPSIPLVSAPFECPEIGTGQ